MCSIINSYDDNDTICTNTALSLYFRKSFVNRDGGLLQYLTLAYTKSKLTHKHSDKNRKIKTFLSMKPEN